MKIPGFFIVIAALFFLGVVAMSCGGDDDDDSSESSGPTDDDADDDMDDDLNDDNDDDVNDDIDDDAPPGPMSLRVMTWNILFDFPDAEYDSWPLRREPEAEVINFHGSDLFGMQEPWYWQVTDLQALCPDYDVARTPVNTDSTIFYRRDRFELIDQGNFWLSPHPERLSIGFGNFMPRFVIWVELYDNESRQQFFFFNTHFDNTNPFQENAAPLYLEKIEEIAGDAPMVTTGDFNSKPDREAYHILTEGIEPGGFALTNSFDLVEDFDIRLTPDDERQYDPSHRIDHIFIANGNWDCSYWVVDMTRYGDPLRDPSDHFAMIADIELDAPDGR